MSKKYDAASLFLLCAAQQRRTVLNLSFSPSQTARSGFAPSDVGSKWTQIGASYDSASWLNCFAGAFVAVAALGRSIGLGVRRHDPCLVVLWLAVCRPNLFFPSR